VLSQRRKAEDDLSFSLCDASGQTSIATFRCGDEGTLLWWLHGFQRRIFEQTKGILRKLKREKDSDNKRRAKLAAVHFSSMKELSSQSVPKAAETGKMGNLEFNLLFVFKDLFLSFDVANVGVII
jgi:hypothetical protein